jgi:hypothetical protein
LLPVSPSLSRRSVLGLGAAGLAGATAWAIESAVSSGAVTPVTRAETEPQTRDLPEIQHDTAAFVAPAVTAGGVAFQFGPSYTLLLTAQLTRTPTVSDQQTLARALAAVEAHWPFSQAGVLTAVAYGKPYLDRLPAPLVEAHLPRLLADRSRPAFEETTPQPTDVSPGNGVTKKTFNNPVVIEANDLLLTLRGDTLTDVVAAGDFLLGAKPLPGTSTDSGMAPLLRPTSSRLITNQPGLPRLLANASNQQYQERVNPQARLWMGFDDHQTGSDAPADITTFAGSDLARLTTAVPGDYFARASVVHLSHVILDLDQYYLPDVNNPTDTEAGYTKRVQYMFRASDPPPLGGVDQFTNGGGTPFVANPFVGTGNAADGAKGIGVPDRTPRLGHVSSLQRTSRTKDGTPLHIRIDGAGFDAIDTPYAQKLPKLHFSMYLPTADTFAAMRRSQAGLDLVRRYGVLERDNGIERFLTTTRRQNFLSPPRSHRAFPLVELT